MSILLLRSGHVVIRPGQRPQGLVISGAFRYVRHPLYLASVLTYVGLTVSTASMLSLGVCVAGFAFHNYIAGYEERLLEMKYGDAYRNYQKRTGKWLPKIGKRL
jgi:protein-S-isoprenylcysteine O-methyltransferase Ste14